MAVRSLRTLHRLECRVERDTTSATARPIRRPRAGLLAFAEHADGEATCAWLKELGVDYVQGCRVHAPDGLALH